MILPALTSPTVAALALAAVAPAPQKSAEPILPPADEALVIEAGAITCLSLLQRYHSVTGENFTYSTEVRERLDRPLLIEQRLEAPVGEVHTAVQELLVQEGFFLSVIRSEDIHILKVEAADGERAPSTRRPAATVLPIARIDTARQYPAMLFMTVVNVESGDVQRLGRALQILVRGRRPDEVLVVANTSSIVLIGTGERVAAMADLLKPESIPDADVLVDGTGSGRPVITEDLVRAARSGSEQPLHVIDIGMPRDVETAVSLLAHVTVRDLDDLRDWADRGRDARRLEAELVRGIVREEVENFELEAAARQAAPLVASMHTAAEAVRRSEVERFAGRLDGLDESQRSDVEQLTRAIVAKLLHEPSVRLKSQAGTPQGERNAAAVRDLFDLR